MENLAITDAPLPQPSAPGGPQMTLGRAPPVPPQQQQLPPQMFTTAAQLLDLTDKKLLVALRDGRKLMGILRSWDQFANLVLQSTVERIFVHPTPSPEEESSSSSPIRDTDTAAAATSSTDSDPAAAKATTPTSTNPAKPRGLYADILHGIFIVRGENVLLLGEIDLDKDDDPPPGYDKAEPDVVKKLVKERKAAAKAKDKRRIKKLGTMGFEGENMGEILL